MEKSVYRGGSSPAGTLIHLKRGKIIITAADISPNQLGMPSDAPQC
jgi:hypothetical protein